MREALEGEKVACYSRFLDLSPSEADVFRHPKDS